MSILIFAKMTSILKSLFLIAFCSILLTVNGQKDSALPQQKVTAKQKETPKKKEAASKKETSKQKEAVKKKDTSKNKETSKQKETPKQKETTPPKTNTEPKAAAEKNGASEKKRAVEKKEGISKKDSTRKKVTELVKDTVQQKADTLKAWDTILVKYIQEIPSTFLKTDAWYFQLLHEKTGDTLVDIIKDYKEFYAQKNSGFKLYLKSASVSKSSAAIFRIEQRFSLPDKDWLFYLIIGLLLIYGLINNLFPQYYVKLFSQFSQSSMRVLQNREQLVQNSFASLSSNIGFILSFSLMSTLLIFNRHLLPISFWLAYLYICAFFILLYLGKYLCLQLVGYIFSVRDLISTYIFVVYMINKVLGILLLPFILVLAFAQPAYYPIAMGCGAVLTILLFLYRYLFTLTSVRNKLHISSFHFFLYLCAFEILPLLILYKFIVQYFGGTF